MNKLLLAGIFLLTLCGVSTAAVQTQMIEYTDGDVVLEGFVAWDDALRGSRPVVLIVHDWMGFGPFANEKAEELAKLGYVGFAVDIFGKGVRPKNVEEASAQATLYKSDRALLRRRALAGLEAVKNIDVADPAKIAVMGYCFGGTTALELARTGAPIRGAVSFHGGLDSPSPADAKNIKAKILVLHGAIDPYVPPSEVQAFEKEMNDAGVDWQMIHYSGAVHSFTKPAAGNDISTGAAYNAAADRRSWVAMKSFFEEVLK